MSSHFQFSIFNFQFIKRIVLLLLMMIGAASFASAQDSCIYQLRPDVLENNEIVLKSTDGTDELSLLLGVKWMQKENKIQLVFDRKLVRGNDLYLLLFSLSNTKETIKNMTDCKSLKKPLYGSVKGDQSKSMQYFLESENLKIDNYRNCYMSLANNNEEEFIFEINDATKDFRIKLPGFYVASTKKKFLSKRDKKLQFKTQPFDLVIKFPSTQRKQTQAQIVDALCGISNQVVAYIEHHKKILQTDVEDLAEAKKNQNCILFNLIKDKIRRNFVENNDKCERYNVCEDVVLALKGYNEICENIIQNEVCVSTYKPTTPNCSISESELTAINNRLKNLQMKINVKKRESGDTDGELKDYMSIKTVINARLTPECRRTYKKTVDAYDNYCQIIEKLF